MLSVNAEKESNSTCSSTFTSNVDKQDTRLNSNQENASHTEMKTCVRMITWRVHKATTFVMKLSLNLKFQELSYHLILLCDNNNKNSNNNRQFIRL
jgi:hypothetical protein